MIETIGPLIYTRGGIPAAACCPKCPSLCNHYQPTGDGSCEADRDPQDGHRLPCRVGTDCSPWYRETVRRMGNENLVISTAVQRAVRLINGAFDSVASGEAPAGDLLADIAEVLMQPFREISAKKGGDA